MNQNNEKFYAILQEGWPAIAAAAKLHSSIRAPDSFHAAICRAIEINKKTEPAELYDTIQRTMREIEDKFPAGTDSVVDAAYNAVHSLYWCVTPAPANKPQLRTGQPKAEKAIIEIRAAMTDIERVYAGLIAAVAADDTAATRSVMSDIERVYIRLQTAVAAA